MLFRSPFVGKDFNITRAGIHADGLMKDEEIYNIFNTEKLLNRPAQVAVSASSGQAGIAHWLAHRCPDEGAGQYDKRSAVVAKMKEMVDAEYARGRTTTMSDRELTFMFRRAKEELGIR